MPKTIHFEGIPGSGKTTASKHLYEMLCDRCIDACWYLEESTDHPIMPKALRELSRTSNFDRICLTAWQSFISELSNVAILDGYVFQSTVRFMYANLIDQDDIQTYFDAWQQIKADSLIIFFKVEDPKAHYELVLSERGPEWTNKLFAYVEQTPFGIENHLQGKKGFVEFWTQYQALCLELLASASVPVKIIESRSLSDKEMGNLVITTI